MSTNAQADAVNAQAIPSENDQDRRIAIVRRIGDFLLRLLQSVLAMEAGLGIYHLLTRTVLAGTGYAALTDLCPVVGYLTIELSIVVLMIALMRFWHRATWRYSLQVSSAMLAPVAILSALALGHVIPMKIVCALGVAGMFAMMMVFMLVRLIRCLYRQMPERSLRMKNPVHLLLTAAAIAAAFSACQSLSRNKVAAEIAAESASQGISPIEQLGSTDRLEILPLVEATAAGPQCIAEHGVSYLVRTSSAVILFDLGFNDVEPNQHSPLMHNMARLGIRLEDIGTIVISHWHPDHVGGTAFWKHHTLSIAGEQPSLEGKRVCVPSPMSYPGLNTVVSSNPTKIAEGVAVIGTLPFAETMGDPGLPDRNWEQALAVNVAGRGVILIIGCGHPGVPKLIERAQAALGQPLWV